MKFICSFSERLHFCLASPSIWLHGGTSRYKVKGLAITQEEFLLLDRQEGTSCSETMSFLIPTQNSQKWQFAGGQEIQLASRSGDNTHPPFVQERNCTERSGVPPGKSTASAFPVQVPNLTGHFHFSEVLPGIG